MAILKNISSLSMPLFLSVMMGSCYSDFNPDIYDKPVLCLNSVIECDKPISVSVTHTWRYSDGWPTQGTSHGEYVDISVYDALLSLYSDGRKVEETTFTENGPDNQYGNPQAGYFFSYSPHAGENITIEAVSEIYGHAKASVTIPEKVDIEKVTNNISRVDTYDWVLNNYKNDPSEEEIRILHINFNDSFKISFTDTPGETNYYRILAEPVNPKPIGSGRYYKDSQGNWIERTYESTLFFSRLTNDREPLLSEHMGIFDHIIGGSTAWFSVFSDRQIQGKTYSLTLGLDNAQIVIDNPQEIPSLYDVGIRFCLSNISESFYNWLIYDWQQSDSVVGNLAEIGAGNAIYPYSNVSTGAGIVAAYTPSTYLLSYSSFLKEQNGIFLSKEKTVSLAK